MPSDREFREVNRTIGSHPSLGPIPASQILPFALSTSTVGFLGSMFSWSLLTMGCLTFWITITWWLASGGVNWRLQAKFYALFLTPNWARGFTRYQIDDEAETHN